MKKFLSLVMIGLMVLLSACGAGGDESQTQTPEGGQGASAAAEGGETPSSNKVVPNDIVIATGNSTGTFYYIGAGQAKILDEAISTISYAVEATTGTKENLVFTSQNPDTIGMTPLDYGYAAFVGDESMDFPDAMPNLRLLMTGHSTSVHFVVLEGSSVQSFEDLRGKRVGLPPNTSGYYVGLRLLAEYGITEDDIDIVLISTSEAGDGLRDGTIDMAVYSAGAPIAAVTDLNMSRQISLLSVDDEAIRASFFEKYPFYYESTIEAGTYNGIDVDTVCVNFPIVLVCNEDLDDDVVYELVKTLNENTDTLAGVHVLGADWNTENTLDNYDNPVIPFHDGAIRYYEEVK